MSLNQKSKQITCPIEKSISLIGSKWSLMIIRLLFMNDSKPMRFNEMLKGLKPISSKTLTSKLAELKNIGVINRKVIDSTPVLIQYSLSEKGQELNGIMNAMADWSLKWNMNE